MYSYVSEEEGQGVVEYVLILGLVSLIVISALSRIGSGVSEVYGSVSGALGSDLGELGSVEYNADDWIVVPGDVLEGEFTYDIGGTGYKGVVTYIGEGPHVEIPREFYVREDVDGIEVVGVDEAGEHGVIVHKVEEVNLMFMDPFLIMSELEGEIGEEDIDKIKRNKVESVSTAPGLKPTSVVGLFLNRGGPIFSVDKGFESVDLSGFDFSEVEDASYMFGACSQLESINFGEDLNTRKVRSTNSMFLECYRLKNIDLSKFDMRSVEDMGSMFMECVDLEVIDGIGNINASSVKDMTAMFYECSSLESLDLSNFDTRNVGNEGMGVMFGSCTKLSKLKLGDKFVIPEGIEVDDMVNEGTHDMVIKTLSDRI